MSKPPKAPLPWQPVPYDDAITAAIRALNTGTATPEMQQRALKWIIETAAGTYDQPFRPGGQDGARETDFACGRMFVGQQIVKQLKIVLPERRIS